jgi:hypothetical protein
VLYKPNKMKIFQSGVIWKIRQPEFIGSTDWPPVDPLLRQPFRRLHFRHTPSRRSVHGRESRKVQGAAVRTTGATDGPAAISIMRAFHDGRGLVRWHGSDNGAAFVVGDIGFIAT